MDTLKPNMYVRTKEGKIFDCYVSEQMGKPIYYPKRSKTNGYIDWNEVYKKSENIIDILEVGDYVNGYEVTSKDQFLGFGNHDWYMTNDEIKSIVTHEQFSAMEYKVESEVK